MEKRLAKMSGFFVRGFLHYTQAINTLPYSLSVYAKSKGGKVVELCSSFGKQRGEYSKPIFQILVYYYYKLFYIVI